MHRYQTEETIEYASVGWRAAAVLVDLLVLFGLLIVVLLAWIAVLVGQGKIDPGDPAAAQEITQSMAWSSTWAPTAIMWCALFIYYVLLESIFGASVGKLVFRMRVIMLDGSRATGLAVVLRNLVRIPEAWLLYIPSVAACATNARRQRLGDHVARTVVVRRAAAGAGPVRAVAPPGLDVDRTAAPGPGRGATAGTTADDPSSDARRVRTTAATAPTPAQEMDAALTELKRAALITRGAHLTFLHFSERELAAQGDDAAEDDYSEGYVSAWLTLADASASLRRARTLAEAAVSAAGQSWAEAHAEQPDLAHLLDALAPYAEATNDTDIHEAYLAVARAEAAPL